MSYGRSLMTCLACVLVFASSAAASDVFGDVERVEDADGLATPWDFAAIGSNVFFSASVSASDRELYVLDIDSGEVRQVADIRPGPESSLPQGMIRFGDHVYFVADDGVHGFELWRSDGTPEGTTLVKDVEPGPASGFGAVIPIPGFAVCGDLLYFAAWTDRVSLWRTDGTSDGTWQVIDARPRAWSSGGPVVTAVDGTAYFSIAGGADEELLEQGEIFSFGALWRSDGTPQGTSVVLDFETPELDAAPGTLVAVNDALVFGAVRLEKTYDAGVVQSYWLPGSLWRSDGTSSGTSQLVDVGLLSPRSLVSLGDAACFDDATGLWWTDGTEDGTRRVRTVVRGFDRLSQLTNVNGTAFFAVRQPARTELWMSDGTKRGTRRLRAFRSPDTGLAVRQITPVGRGRLCVFVVGRDGGTDEIWSSDGTRRGTRRLGSKRGFLSIGELESVRRSVVFGGVSEFRAPYSLWTVAVPGLGSPRSDVDSDRDGFPDDVEAAVGSDAFDAGVTPGDVGPSSVSGDLRVDRLRVRMNVPGPESDRVVLRGLLSLNGQPMAAGSRVWADVGGVVREFTLDANLASETPSGTFQVRGRHRARAASGRGQVRFVATLEGADVRPALLDEGLVDANERRAVHGITANVFIGNVRFRGERAVRYTSREGMLGVAR